MTQPRRNLVKLWKRGRLGEKKLEIGAFKVDTEVGIQVPYETSTDEIQYSSNIKKKSDRFNIVMTNVAPNLINDNYLERHSQRLLNRFSHLKGSIKMRIGVFIGGDSKNVLLEEGQIKALINQLREIARELNAEILLTTSRNHLRYHFQLL